MRIALATAALVLSLGAAPLAQGAGDAGSAGAALADAGTPAQPLPPPRPLPPIPSGLGRVAGKVTLVGPPPPRPALPVAPDGAAPTPPNRDARACGMDQPDPSLQLGLGGGLLEVVLWAPDGPAPERGAHPVARVAIEACSFQPHLLVTTVGADLTLVNRDPLYHNVTGSGLEQFSYALVLKDHDVPMRVKKAGLLTLESKLRPWMLGFVQVLPTTAWSMTDTDGSYFLDLPPGRHVVKLWHERFGEREETVEVAAGETTFKDFALSAAGR